MSECDNEEEKKKKRRGLFSMGDGVFKYAQLEVLLSPKRRVFIPLEAG